MLEPARITALLLLAAIVPIAQRPTSQRPAMPKCAAEPDRRAERVNGTADKGKLVVKTTPAGWMLQLRPDEFGGWLLSVTTKDRATEDLSRLTPPWHFAPNAREIDGWHFRNADNTGPNDGTVNAPGELREFIFSPAVGRDLEYHGSGTTPEDVDNVRAFGRGWFYIESYRLTPPKRGERAAFETITFSACLTWPAR